MFNTVYADIHFVFIFELAGCSEFWLGMPLGCAARPP